MFEIIAIVVLLILAGVAAGFFLSTLLVLILSGIFVVALVFLWPRDKEYYGGAGPALAFTNLGVLLFIIPMVITAIIVRLVGAGPTVNWWHVGVWLNHHIFRQ